MIQVKEKPLKTALRMLECTIEGLNPKLQGILARWLETWSRLIRKESVFNPVSAGRLKRGEIILVDFGYNIGNEMGGMHDAIVLEKENSRRSGTVMVMPLTSLKGHEDPENLKRGKVYLGGIIPESNRESVARSLSITTVITIYYFCV